MAENQKRQRKGVKAKAKKAASSAKVEAPVEPVGPTLAQVVGLPCGAVPGNLMADELTSEVELSNVSLTAASFAFLERIAAQFSQKTGNYYSPEMVTSYIVETWALIYQDSEDGGIEQSFTEEPPEPDDPDFQAAFEGALV